MQDFNDMKVEFYTNVKKILADIGVDDSDDFLDFYIELPFVDIADDAKRDNILLTYNVFNLLKLQYEKECGYGNSWEKRGEIGVFFNIARKWDRLENYILNGNQLKGETLEDTIADIAIYMMLWLTKLIREQT